MLFIGDLHFKPEMEHRIFEKLEKTLENTKENEIIFLGDYIYHFNYRPKIIGRFFDLLLKGSQKGKKIFVLAGNHDYISGHFIFTEVEKITNLNENSNLQIISSPKISKIGKEKVLFFPFFTNIANEEDFAEIDKRIKELKNHKHKQILINLFFAAYQSWKQDNKNMKISGSINLELVKQIYENEDIDIIVHHFYIENTSFPGQFSKFSFKNIAISKEIFKFEGKVISGHLHKSFIHENYTCVGSFRNTSMLEQDDTKVIFTYPNKFEQIFINPYISIEAEDQIITKEDVLQKWDNIIKETEDLLNTKLKRDEFELKKISLIIRTNQNTKIEDLVSLDLLNEIQDVKIMQKNGKKLGNILNDLEIDKDQLAYSFSSWKQLAKDYIEKKYPDSKKKYLDILGDLDLL